MCNSGYELIFVGSNEEGDAENCGGFVSACSTFEYVINNVSTNPKGIIINNGEYNFSYANLSSQNISIEGMISDYYGNVNVDNISTYPKIIADGSGSSVDSKSVFTMSSSNAMFQYVQLLFSSNSNSLLYYFSSFNLFLFYLIFKIYIYKYILIFNKL
jgi:hypothetical protein